MPYRYHTILFDVDGTLIDSAPGILNTLRQTFAAMGVSVPESRLKGYLGPPLRRSFGEWFDTEEQIEEATVLYRRLYKEKGSHECRLYPGVPEMLEELQRTGLCLCTATSKPTDVVMPILKEQGIDGYFSMVGGASLDKSKDTKTAVMQDVLSRLHADSGRVLMVGDRRDDMQGALECGVHAAAALYGYGSRDEVAPFCPVFYAESCRQLTDYILKNGEQNE